MFYETKLNNHGLPHDPLKACLVPRPIGWITSMSPDGVANLAPYSFFNGVSSEPPMIMFASNGKQPYGRKDTLANVESTKEFVVNFVTAELKDKMNDSCAPLRPDDSEFEFAKIEKLDSHLIMAPRVKGAPVHLECKHYNTYDLPSNSSDVRNAIVVGSVVGVHIDEHFLVDGKLDITKMRPLARLGYMDYCIVDEVFQMKRPAAPPSYMTSNSKN